MTLDYKVNGNPLSWLLEIENPEVRYLALRDLEQLPYENPELKAMRQAAHQQGPIAHILEKMDPEGYWQKPGPGYGPKYKSTVWSLMLLAQLGGEIREDERIGTACTYLLDNALASGGQFAYNQEPSGTIDCLQGNLCWTLLKLGCEDPRIQSAYDWMARSVTGDGIAPNTDRKAPIRYYAYKCGPNFACGANNKMPCAWGATKVMLAFGILPKEKHTPMIEKAIQMGLDFFLNTALAKAEFPNGFNDHPSRNWWKFGFPVFYVTDLLQTVEALVSLGAGKDPRLENALEIILNKQDDLGRWPLEYDYAGKTWRSYGKPNEPNKWVTLRALRVLKSI
ncbi:MAG: hypothetical protein Q7U31_06165 [Anaerolineaceae bacterium]|nr:hypothetical protein [Anaerolineaceae bacterium]